MKSVRGTGPNELHMMSHVHFWSSLCKIIEICVLLFSRLDFESFQPNAFL